MSTLVQSKLSQFALDVAEGLSAPRQKFLSPKYLYDDLGSLLFEAITVLPEYGLTRADEKLLSEHAGEIARTAGCVSLVAELGSGSGHKTSHVLRALRRQQPQLVYRPIDVSAAAVSMCEREIKDLAIFRPVLGEWIEALAQIAKERSGEDPMLLLFLGSSVGNLDRRCLTDFLQQVRRHLREGDSFLLGADLVKDIDTMLQAYDDPTGVTAAFNLNLLGRINRELGANFDLRSFTHEARWNSDERRIEMHLVSSCYQGSYIESLDRTFHFEAGETIWTESSHKFTEFELSEYAKASGFAPARTWVDESWPFIEALWRPE